MLAGVLLALSLGIGALGGTLGMFIFRHKTRHWYFRVFFPLLLFLQAGILGWLWSRGIL